MQSNIYIQNICGDCLQAIVNGEDDPYGQHDSETMEKTLRSWAKRKYFPAGLTDNTEPSFSWQKCDLCNDLAGNRYEYYFRDERKSTLKALKKT
jgi:hypothetical protein